MAKATCSIEGCERLGVKRGWCELHYSRWRRHGNPATNPTSRALPAPERFWAKVDRRGDDECWSWLAATDRGGYGAFTVERRSLKAHRFAYELLVGPIPEGLTLDHLCRNPTCVNPAHLEPVTAVENVMRGYSPHAINARRTHCTYGHEFTEANTVIRHGHRQCRACGN